jgi:hypothetical protein
MGSFVSPMYSPNVSFPTLLEEGPLFKMECFSSHMHRNHFILILLVLSFHLTINSRPGEVIHDDQLVNIRPLIFFTGQINGFVESMTDFQVR